MRQRSTRRSPRWSTGSAGSTGWAKTPGSGGAGAGAATRPAGGGGASGDGAANDDAEWARVLDVNVTGTARVTRAALPHLRRSPHAAVVNMCSAVAFVGVRG